MQKSVTENVFIRYRDSKQSRMCPGLNDTLFIRGGVGTEFFRDLESRAGFLGISEYPRNRAFKTPKNSRATMTEIPGNRDVAF